MERRDALIERLRQRVEQPERRTDWQFSQFQHFARTLSGAQLIARREEALNNVAELLNAQEQGQSAPEALRQRANRLATMMKTPAPRTEPLPASSTARDAARKDLGFGLPEGLSKIYGAVADGGFGPGPGLLSLAGIAEAYLRLRSYDIQPRWPERMLPIHDESGVCHCIERESGQILRFDAEQLNDDNSNLLEVFETVAECLEQWLERWLDGPAEAEFAAAQAKREETLAAARQKWSEKIEAYIAELRAKSPGEREAMGLTGDGWEECLRQNLGGCST